MGHVGEKGTFGDIGQARLVPGILKYLLLFHLISDFVIYASGPKDDPGDAASVSRIGDAQLEVLDFMICDGPVIDIKCLAAGQFLPDIFRSSGLRHQILIFSVDPGGYI